MEKRLGDSTRVSRWGKSGAAWKKPTGLYREVSCRLGFTARERTRKQRARLAEEWKKKKARALGTPRNEIEI